MDIYQITILNEFGIYDNKRTNNHYQKRSGHFKWNELRAAHNP